MRRSGFKRSLLRVIFSGILTSGIAHAEAEGLGQFRAFTASDGRAIEAKIVAWNPTSRKLQIERTNHKKV